MVRPGKQAPKNMLSRMMIGITLGIVVIAIFLLIADLNKVTGVMMEMPAGYLLLAFLLTFGSYMLRLYKWHVFSNMSGFKVTLRDNMAIFFTGLMMSITPGKAGELIKSFILEKKAGVPYSRSVPVVIYDRMTDLLAMMALVAIGLFVYPFGLHLLIVMFVLMVLLFILLQRQTLITKLIAFVTKPIKFERFREPLHHFYEQTLFLMRFRILGFAFVVSFISWLLEAVSLYIIILAFPVDVSFVASILTFSLGTLAGAVSMIPGGLGAAEASITGLLMYFGIESSLAVAISLIIRFVTLWFGVILGVLVFIVKRKSLFASR